MKKWMIALAAVGLLGCGDDASGDSIVRDLVSVNDDTAEYYCGCYFEALEYDSEAACLSDNAFTAAESECLVNAYGPVADLNPSQARCQLNALRDAVACYRRLGCTATEEQIDACDVMNDPETICGSDDICYGLAGTDLTECQAAAASADTAADACFPE